VGSPEHGLAGAVMARSSPWIQQHGEGSSPILTDGSDERRRDDARPATERSVRAVVVLGDVLWARSNDSNNRDGN
jgi:hypothetical protein